jgi:hypothetical protein
MNIEPLTSYLRHLFVTGILFFVEKFKLPIEGSKDAANIIALAIIGTLTWVFAKYIAPRIRIPKKSKMALFALSAAMSLITVSCVGTGNENIKLSITSEGCPAIGSDKFKVAACPNGDIITIWQQIQLNGSIITAKAIKPKNGKVRLYYEQNGVFVAYDPSAKSSITIGAIPVSEAEVIAVIEETQSVE